MRAMVGWLFSFVVVVVVVARAHRARQRVTYARDANADPRNTKKKTTEVRRDRPMRRARSMRARWCHVRVACAVDRPTDDDDDDDDASRIADGVTDDDDDDGSTAQATRPAVMATDRV